MRSLTALVLAAALTAPAGAALSKSEWNHEQTASTALKGTPVIDSFSCNVSKARVVCEDSTTVTPPRGYVVQFTWRASGSHHLWKGQHMYTIDVYFATEYGSFAHGAFAASDNGCGSYLCKRKVHRHFET